MDTRYAMLCSIILLYSITFGFNFLEKDKYIQFNDKEFHIHFKLNVPFKVIKGGQFIICHKLGAPLPVEPFQDLFLVSPTFKVVERKFKYISWITIQPYQFIKIDNLDKLHNLVEIKTCEEVLSFVRLKTSPRTYYLFDDYWEVEVITRDQIDTKFTFGDKLMAQILSKSGGNGYLGIVGSKSKLKELGIEPTKVRKVKKGFEIERTLVVADLKLARGYALMMGHPKGALRVIRVVEFVTTKGGYIRKKAYQLNSPKIFAYPWSIDTFE